MPKVPEYNHKPIKSLYTASEGPATIKQKSLLITLFERRKATPPDLKNMTSSQASTLIDSMLNPR